MQAIIEAVNVYHRYGKQASISQFNLNLQCGEVMALLGANGAGKTTALRLLTGNLMPTRGQIFINGIDLNRQPQKAKHHLGYLPDVAPLYEDMHVDEYLIYCARIHGLSRPASQSRLQQVKKFCELQTCGLRLIKKLSKGYRQRIGIAQAIIHQPAVIILDEPTNGLDPAQIQEVRGLIEHLRNNAAVLLSTHQLNEVEQICDRVHIIKNGRTVFTKSISELKDSRRIRLRFAHNLPIDDLNNHQDIAKVTRLNEATVDISCDSNPDNLKSALLSMAHHYQWSLLEIHDVHDSLENVFIKEVLRDSH